MASRLTIGKGQVVGNSVMLWAMFCKEILGSAMHVDVTLIFISCISIAQDHKHPFMQMLLVGGFGFWHGEAPCHI